MVVKGRKMRLTLAWNQHEQRLWDSKIETLKESDVTVTAQVLQRAASQIQTEILDLLESGSTTT